MTSDFRYEIITELKLRYLLSDLKLLTFEKSGFVLYVTNNFLCERFDKQVLILVDPVDDEDWRDRPRTDPFQ